MSRRAVFRTVARFDQASRFCDGFVIVEREAGLITARRSRSRKECTLPLSIVADMICGRVIRAEQAERKREKAAARKARGGR